MTVLLRTAGADGTTMTIYLPQNENVGSYTTAVPTSMANSMVWAVTSHLLEGPVCNVTFVYLRR